MNVKYLLSRIKYYYIIAKYWKRETVFLVLLLLIYMLYIKKETETKRIVFAVLLGVYTFYIFLFTVLSRAPIQIYQYKIIPFWSYFKILCGEKKYIKEVLLNIIVFIPEGFLITYNFDKWSVKKYIIIGFIMSTTIEVLQLLLKRGMFELDDILGNTLGIVFGTWIINHWRQYIRVNKMKRGKYELD